MNKNLLAKLALLLTALIWGSSFVIVKDAVTTIPPNFLIAVRFTAAAVILALVFIKRLKKIDKNYIISGVVTGVFIFLAYSIQTVGITQTTPGKNAFLTAVYCVLVPFIGWAFTRIKPDIYNIVAACLCITGIFLIAVKDNFSIGFGDAFSLLGGLFFAAHMVAVAKLTKDKDPILITILQFFVAGLCSWIAGFIFEKAPDFPLLSPKDILSVGFLCIFCTLIGLLLQNIGQKYTDPSAAAIILSLESVFGVIFSVAAGQDKLSLRLIVGFAVIFAAIVISETKLSFLKKKGQKLKA